MYSQRSFIFRYPPPQPFTLPLNAGSLGTLKTISLVLVTRNGFAVATSKYPRRQGFSNDDCLVTTVVSAVSSNRSAAVGTISASAFTESLHNFNNRVRICFFRNWKHPCDHHVGMPSCGQQVAMCSLAYTHSY